MGILDFNPSFLSKKSSISLLYPAKITTSLSLLSSIILTSSFIASIPKSFSPPADNEYASSINKTPSNADSITSRVWVAVCPTYPATRSERFTSTNLFVLRIFILYKISATILAIFVFPVPEFPLNIICLVIVLLLPISFFCSCTFNLAFHLRIKFFTSSNPITSEKASSMSNILLDFILSLAYLKLTLSRP